MPSHCWVLVPASGTGRTRTPDSEARAPRHKRQRKKERRGVGPRRSTLNASVDPKDTLLASALCCSLTTAESDARRLRLKNANALQVAIQLSKRGVAKKVAAKAKAARHAKGQARLLCRLSGMRCNSEEEEDDDNDASTFGFNDDDDDVPPHADAYTEDGHNCLDDRKGKGAARKW
ncbi:hypothetical protein D1007_21668 [Hordeum vulgare]|nr:hypothetical protein D1007_21668 [Hordeum vulgare]